MSLIGLPTVTLAAVVAGLAGNERTRAYTAKVYAAFLAVEIGLLGGLVATAAWLAQSTTALAGGLL